MDEYLTEREQIELMKQWWRENRWYLIGGVALAVIAYFGYREYRDYTNQQAEASADLYIELQETLADDSGREEELLARLRTDYAGSPYTQQANLLMAREVLISDTPRAAQLLRDVMQTSDDPGLAFVARLRLARVLSYQGQHAEALEILDVEDSGAFTPRFHDVRGDVHAAAGDLDAAREAYAQALTAVDTSAIDRTFVQMKLAALTQSAPLSTEAPSGEASPAESEAPAAQATENAPLTSDTPAEGGPPTDAGQPADGVPSAVAPAAEPAQ